MKYKTDFFKNYLKYAPASLALERSIECAIYSRTDMLHPVLDIGCGDGLFAYILFGEKIDTGIDPSRSELKRATAYCTYAELIECAGNQIPKDAGSYNSIISNSVLEHIEDLRSVLSEARRLLARNGVFHLTVPTHLYQTYSVGSRLLEVVGIKTLRLHYEKFFNRFWRHYHCYSPDQWLSIFRDCGFEAVEIIQYGSRKSCLMMNLLLPFAVWCWTAKLLFHRWTLFPSLRAILTRPLSRTIDGRFIEEIINIESGGLVYFKLTGIPGKQN